METQTNETAVDNTNLAPVAAPEGPAFRAAYTRRLAEIQAVKEDELIRVTLDVHSAVATVLGALPEIRALRDRLAKIPEMNMALVDGLEDYAEAASEANSRYVTATTPGQEIVDLNAEAEQTRDMLRADTAALTGRGLLDPARVAGLKGLKGYKNVGFELIDWANVLEDSWKTIQGKTAIAAEELVSARQLGERLVRAAGLREQAPATVAEVAHLRQQALTLLVNAYDEVRRGISFLRWQEGDVETIAPSLYAGRGKPARADKPPPAPTPGAPEPGAPAAAAPAAPVTGATVQPAAPVLHIAPGMPGAKLLID